MLKSMEGSRKYISYILGMLVFGLAGLLLVLAVRYIIRAWISLSERHPKVCRWIDILVSASLILISLYLLFIKREWYPAPLVCIVLASDWILHTKSR